MYMEKIYMEKYTCIKVHTLFIGCKYFLRLKKPKKHINYNQTD